MPLKIVRNDIAKICADIIVNSANPKPIYANGTDAAIYEAAGAEKLLKCRQEIGEIGVGDIAVTPAFKLSSKHIIHTVGPNWHGGEDNEFELLASCYKKSLHKAYELGAESIAFPLISTGVYQFPRDRALQVAITTISEFLLEFDMLVILVVFDQKSFELCGRIFQEVDEYIDQFEVACKSKIEYGINRMDSDYESAVRNMKETDKDFNRSAVGKNSLEALVENEEDTFQERLLKLIDLSGLKDPDVYRRANIDRKLFSKIRCDSNYTPRKKTVLALAVALELDLEEARDLMNRAGQAFSPCDKFDLIVEYYIKHRVYDINVINLSLFEHGQQMLGV